MLLQVSTAAKDTHINCGSATTDGVSRNDATTSVVTMVAKYARYKQNGKLRYTHMSVRIYICAKYTCIHMCTYTSNPGSI